MLAQEDGYPARPFIMQVMFFFARRECLKKKRKYHPLLSHSFTVLRLLGLLSWEILKVSSRKAFRLKALHPTHFFFAYQIRFIIKRLRTSKKTLLLRPKKFHYVPHLNFYLERTF